MKSKYSAEEKFQIVMESFTDNVTQAEICQRHGIYPVQLSKWREQINYRHKKQDFIDQSSETESLEDIPVYIVVSAEKD